MSKYDASSKIYTPRSWEIWRQAASTICTQEIERSRDKQLVWQALNVFSETLEEFHPQA